ncbi:MAG: hypothetical protein IPK82_18010 [Polyangiaceae bacterium]|nr:hypothetical protein [Polyangiaceae bacterium]
MGRRTKNLPMGRSRAEFLGLLSRGLVTQMVAPKIGGQMSERPRLLVFVYSAPG